MKEEEKKPQRPPPSPPNAQRSKRLSCLRRDSHAPTNAPPPPSFHPPLSSNYFSINCVCLCRVVPVICVFDVDDCFREGTYEAWQTLSVCDRGEERGCGCVGCVGGCGRWSRVGRRGSNGGAGLPCGGATAAGRCALGRCRRLHDVRVHRGRHGCDEACSDELCRRPLHGGRVLQRVVHPRGFYLHSWVVFARRGVGACVRRQCC